MKSYTTDELRSCLVRANVADGDLIMVHSSLLGLGRLKDHSFSQVPLAIAECLRDVVGPTGTIVVPAFSFAFCRGDSYDPDNSPSQNMGVLSEWFRCHRDAVRGRHPMQSIAAIGPMAKELCEPDTPSAFDPGGAFDLMIKNNATLVLLGANFQAASVIHYSEQQIGVPYRYWKDFTGPYQDQNRTAQRTYRMYVRDLALDPKLRMDPIEDELVARNQVRIESLGAGKIRSCSFQNLIHATDDCLKRDPWCLVSERTN